MNRVQVIKGSQSGHCCFGFSIIDTGIEDAQPEKDLHAEVPDKKYLCLAECIEQHHALAICKALNVIDAANKGELFIYDAPN